VSPLDGEVPPAGEQVHVPKPSLLPVLATVGVTLALVGVTVSIIFTIVGLLIAIPVIVYWIRTAREELGELPPGH
jgi:Flp pilus assembly protein TadB